MNKYSVTEELALLIKTLRMKNKIPSKDLSAKIGKSASYISKLESGNIRMISEDELTTILSEITEGKDFYQDKLVMIAKMLFLSTAPERLSAQLWFFNYDMVKRWLTIPEKLIYDLNNIIAETEVSLPALVNEINANLEISQASNLAGYPVNQWVEHHSETATFPIMRVLVEEETLQDILNGHIQKANYITLYSISFVLLKIKRYGLDITLSVPEATMLMQETSTYLNEHEFHTLIAMNRMFNTSLSLDEQKSMLAVFSSVNITLLNQIISHFQRIAEFDEMNANQVLSAFQDNLTWNSGFISKLISLPFNSLGNMSYNMNKQLLEDIYGILERYKDKPDFEKEFEVY